MRAVLVSAAAAALLCVTPANAATTVLGDGLAHICSEVAKAGLDDPRAIDVCTMAIENGGLTRYDLAGTYVNRGVLKMRHKSYKDAHTDFNIAIKLAPTMGEAFINRGGALVGERQYEQALNDLNHGLELGPEEPEKGYYNRGLAHEAMNNYMAAYFDYQRAASLKPDWDPPQHELLRYSVKSAN